MEEHRQISGRYRLTGRVGGGAMGIVWLGHDERLNRTVAIKELVLPYGLSEPEADAAKQRAMREGRLAARLQHPHAIPVFDVVEHDGAPWLVMEYLESVSLSAAVVERGPLPPVEVAAIGTQIASALAAAHAVGIVHRDVKPSNILLAPRVAKITDFGISRAIGEATLTATGMIAGTPAYLAPEVARGEPADFRSDVFSFGATLYTAVEGVPPFGRADNPMAMLHRVASGDVRPPELAGPLAPLLRQLMDIDPTRRPTMVETARVLAALAGSPRHVPPLEPVTEPLAVPPPPPPAPVERTMLTPAVPLAPVPAAPAAAPRPKRRRRLVVALLVAAVVLGLGGGAMYAYLNRDRSNVAEPEPTTSQQQPRSSPPAPSTPPPTTEAPTTTAAEGLVEYYALLPEDLEGAYARLSDRFKRTRSGSFDQYSRFFNQFRSISTSNVRLRDDGSVSASVTYVRKTGGRTTERHIYRLVLQDDTWMIDSQRSA